MEIAIVGATGLVGEILIQEIEKYIPASVHIFSSTSIHSIRPFTELNLDVILFATPPSVSLTWIPLLLQKTSAYIIDGSEAFRKDPQVPLIIPEINGHLLSQRHRLISSPNCTTTLALMALYSLHACFKLTSFSLCSYQAASGAGRNGLQEFEKQIKDWVLEGTTSFTPQNFPKTLLFNAIPQIGKFSENGNSSEEEKINLESQKILNLPSLTTFATCVRIPALQCHSIALSATFEKTVSLQDARTILKQTPGVVFYENTYPDVYNAQGNSLVHVGRLRKDPTRENALSMWIVGDQLRKGAASNMRQILSQLLTL